MIDVTNKNILVDWLDGQVSDHITRLESDVDIDNLKSNLNKLSKLEIYANNVDTSWSVFQSRMKDGHQ